MTARPGEAEDQNADETLPDGLVHDEAADRRAVTRMCALTRQTQPVGTLLRFVAGPDGVVVPDIRNRLPGRGVWLGCAASNVREAARRKLFSRALKQTVSAPDDLAGLVGTLLAKDALQVLSLVSKAGALTTGFAKIEGMRGPVLALVQASDGSRGEISRLRGLMSGKGVGRGTDKGEPAFVEAFSSAELGLSIGREHVIHAALVAHEVSALFLARARRYVEFMASGPARQDNASTNGPVCVQDVPRA